MSRSLFAGGGLALLALASFVIAPVCVRSTPVASALSSRSQDRDAAAERAFADRVLARVKALGLGLEFRYDPNAFALRGEDERVVYLEKLRRDGLAAAETERREEIDRFLRAIARSFEELPPTYAAAKSRIFPVIRVRDFLRSVARTSDAVVEAFWTQPLGDYLEVALVYDRPESISYLSSGQLQRWAVTPELAYRNALANLAASPGKGFDPVDDGIYSGEWADYFGSSRLLLADPFEGLEIEGDPVVWIPSSDAIFVTGSKNDAGLTRIAGFVETLLAGPRVITGMAFTPGSMATTWRPFVPGESSPAHGRLQRLFEVARAERFALQHAWLEARFAEEGRDVYLAEYTLYTSTLNAGTPGAGTPGAAESETEARERVRSYCVWSRGVESLLPRTERIVFYDPERAADERVLGSVEWEVFRAKFPSLLVAEPDLYDRFATRGFPDRAELEPLLEKLD